MQHTCNWTDLYGAVHASFEGRSGGHRWLLALPEAAGDAALDSTLAALGDLDGKGRVDLLVFSDPTAVSAAIAELRPRGLLLLEGEPTGDWTAAGLAVRQSTAAAAKTALESWMDEVPHGR